MNIQSNHNIQSVSGVLDIQHWVTSKGTPVYFVHAPNLPIFDIQVAFDAGSARDGQQKGIAHLTSMLLSEGTKLLDADKVAEQFEEVGAEFDVASYRDMAIVSLRSLNQPELMNPVFNTFVQVLSKPAFLEAGFKREQAQALIELQYEGQSPDSIAKRLFFSKLYPEHPYANASGGTMDALKKLTPNDVDIFYKKYYVAKNASISIVGDLSLQAAQTMAQSVSNALEEGEAAPDLPAVKDILHSSTPEKVIFPSEQTHIMMGMPGMKRNDSDFFSLLLGNHILGGNGTVTRIFNEIRHKRGLAYDTHSYFAPMKERGPFVIGLQTKTDQAWEALKVLKDTLSTFIKSGPTDLEVTEAKLNILGGYALSFDNNKAILSQLTLLGFYHLPLDYFDTYKKNIENVSAASIQEAFARRVQPDKMVVVMVGR